MVMMVITGVLIGKYFYWHQGQPGTFERYDEHGEAIGFGATFWPLALPLILIYYLVRREPKSIRKARRKKELKEFAEREGLEL